MKVKSETVLSLVLHLITICPSFGSNIIVGEAPSKQTTFLTDLPPELMADILSRPKVYDSFIRAVPLWHGNHEVELNCLIRVLSGHRLSSWDELDQAGYLALRLTAPKPLDWHNPDITLVSPSAVFKWIRFLRKRCKSYSLEQFSPAHYELNTLEENLPAFLFYFARSPHFDSWYSLCSEDEKMEFKRYISTALFMAGKIHSAVHIFSEDMAEVNFQNNANFPYLHRILLWGCFEDDIDHFDKVLSSLSKYHVVELSDILQAGVNATAKQIVAKFIKKMAKEHEKDILWHAVEANDADLFVIVLKECIPLEVDMMIEVLIYISSSPSSNSDILFVFLLHIEYDLIKERNQDLLHIMINCLKFGLVAVYKMLRAWISLNDKDKMDRLEVDLLPSALKNRNDYFIKHMLKKNSTGHYRNPFINLDVIVDTLRSIPARSIAYSLTTKLFLSIVPSGNSDYDEFMAHELLPLLIKLKHHQGCAVALSRDNGGCLVYPFINVSLETVAVALDKCPDCLLYLPTGIVNDYIHRNPNCYKHSPAVYSVLTSAKNGKPRFHAMKPYFSATYLLDLFTDPSLQNELIIFSQSFIERSIEFKSQSMFTLVTFTPELNVAVTKAFTPQLGIDFLKKTTWRIPPPYDALYQVLLYQRKDGSPLFESFEFTRNVLLEVGFLQLDYGKTILRSYNGHLLYRLSLTFLDESGQERHLLTDLPKIFENDVETIRRIVGILLNTDLHGNFILQDINEQLILGIVESFKEEHSWYSELLLQELEKSQPPWPVRAD